MADRTKEIIARSVYFRSQSTKTRENNVANTAELHADQTALIAKNAQVIAQTAEKSKYNYRLECLEMGLETQNLFDVSFGESSKNTKFSSEKRPRVLMTSQLLQLLQPYYNL